jgi:hypothetical protein
VVRIMTTCLVVNDGLSRKDEWKFCALRRNRKTKDRQPRCRTTAGAASRPVRLPRQGSHGSGPRPCSSR